MMAAIAASSIPGSVAPFSCGPVSFVIVENLRVMLSEIIQSERWWRRRDLEIHRHETTSSVAAPGVVTKAERARQIRIPGLARRKSPCFGNHLDHTRISARTLVGVAGPVKKSRTARADFAGLT